MKEILFRGKRIDNGEWVLGATFVTIYQENTALAFMPQAGESVKADVMNSNDRILTSIHGKFYQVFPATVGQYTGLTDKNGKKIFEGDIVVVPLSGKPAKGIVEYFKTDICGFAVITQPQYSNYVLQKNYAYEVIGNIHDNPELLGVDK